MVAGSEAPDPDPDVPLDKFLETAVRVGERYSTPPSGTLRMELVVPSPMTETVLESIAAFRVACQWHRYWLDRVAVGDTEAVDLATPVLMEIPKWPVFSDMNDVWPQFIAGIEDAMIDGPRSFTESNCPEVRDELPPPEQMSIFTATSTVLSAVEHGSLVTPANRSTAIDRIGATIPMPTGTSFQPLSGVAHSETEVALAATLRQYAWCQWLGLLIDSGDRGDRAKADSVLTELQWFVDSGVDSQIDSATSHTEMEYVVDTAREGNGYWAVADYRNNCFAIDVERDARLNGG